MSNHYLPEDPTAFLRSIPSLPTQGVSLAPLRYRVSEILRGTGSQNLRPAEGMNPPPIFTARTLALSIGATLLAIISCLLYLPITVRIVQFGNDYRKHIAFAEQLYHTHQLVVPHFLFHLLMIGVVKLGGTSFPSAALIVLGASYCFTAVLVYREAAQAIFPTHCSRAALAWAAATALVLGFAILLMQPILSPRAPHVYELGYFWAEPYENPTYSLMKPFALATAIIAVAFLATAKARPSSLVVAAIVTAAGTLAKPNFVMCLLPAVILLGAYRGWRREAVDWKAICLGLLIPGAAVLLFEFYLSYSGLGPHSIYHNAVVFAPFKVLRPYGGKVLPFKLGLSVAFPVAVYVLYWKDAVRDVRLNFAFLLFAFGAGYGLLLSEVRNWQAGNFLWGSYVTLFILFVFTTTFFVGQLKKASWNGREGLRHAAAALLLLLHLHSGLLVEIATLHQKII